MGYESNLSLQYKRKHLKRKNDKHNVKQSKIPNYNLGYKPVTSKNELPKVNEDNANHNDNYNGKP